MGDLLTVFGPKPEGELWDEFSANLGFAGGGLRKSDPGSLLEVLAEATTELEGTQNLAALRFGDRIFEEAWNREHVRGVQIDIPETLDIDDRAESCDQTGAFLDMIVTHLFQVAAEIAMEPPLSMDADDLQAARELVIAGFRPLSRDDVVFGQFEGYTETEGGATDSSTDTFVAARFGAIDLRIVVKEPGPDFQLASGTTALPLAEDSEADPLPPYVKLSNIAPILENPPTLLPYARGSWGPDAAAQLAAPDGWLLGQQRRGATCRERLFPRWR